MLLFTIILSHFMIAFPAVYGLLVPERIGQAATDRRHVQRSTLQLFLLTAGVLVVWWLVFLFVSSSYWPWLGTINLLAFFWLFFMGTIPLMRIKNPDWTATPPHDLPQRNASLEVRQHDTTVMPRWSLYAMWLVWCAVLLSVLMILDWSALIAASGESIGRERVLGLAAMLIAVTMVCCPAVAIHATRRERFEPQPMDMENSEELQQLYRRRRRQRAMLFIVLGWTLLVLSSVVAVGMALMSRGTLTIGEEHGQILGWAGAIVGSVIGLAGGIAGTLSSIQAARINQRLRTLTMQQEAS